MAKKYYWLKLKEDFFDDDTISFIEEQENGVYYVNFYLKLCLKSVKTEGKLIRLIGENLIPYDVKSLSKLTGVPVDTVVVAMKLFESIGLVKILETGEIYLSQINELIGTETDKARIMRQKRAVQKLDGNNVTTLLPRCYPEKEEEKDKEKEIDKKKEEEDVSLFLSLYLNSFLSIFNKKPNKSHLTAVKNLYINGKSQETILNALESVKGKQIDEPEPYVYSVIKAYKGGELNGTECKGNTGHDDNKYGLNVTVL